MNRIKTALQIIFPVAYILTIAFICVFAMWLLSQDITIIKTVLIFAVTFLCIHLITRVK